MKRDYLPYSTAASTCTLPASGRLLPLNYAVFAVVLSPNGVLANNYLECLRSSFLPAAPALDCELQEDHLAA